jgi:DNA recombination protein RmuC
MTGELFVAFFLGALAPSLIFLMLMRWQSRERERDALRQMDGVKGEIALLRTELGGSVARAVEWGEKTYHEAHGFTSALRVDIRAQGHWGELALQRILTRSGLEAGIDFIEQPRLSSGGRPDLLVRLPGNRHLVIDSKVSLGAFTRYLQSDDDASKEEALQEHINSLRAQVQSLAERGYAASDDLRSPELVFLFCPIEGAVLAALDREPELIEKAWQRGVAVVTPLSLLPTLRTVASVWRRHEAERSGEALVERSRLMSQSLDEVTRELRRLELEIGRMGEIHRQLRAHLLERPDSLGQQLAGVMNRRSAVQEENDGIL